MINDDLERLEISNGVLVIINAMTLITLFYISRKGAKNRKEDLITHVDIICYYSN